MPTYTFEIHGHVPSSANLREHWATKAKRVKRQRLQAALLCRMTLPEGAGRTGAMITLTRVSPRKLDAHDNLAASFKGFADGIADAIGLDDGSPLLQWVYAQEVGKPAHVRVTIETPA